MQKATPSRVPEFLPRSETADLDDRTTHPPAQRKRRGAMDARDRATQTTVCAHPRWLAVRPPLFGEAAHRAVRRALALRSVFGDPGRGVRLRIARQHLAASGAPFRRVHEWAANRTLLRASRGQYRAALHPLGH